MSDEREPIKVIGDILLQQLGIAQADGRVMLAYQKWPIPPGANPFGGGAFGAGPFGSGFYIALSYIGSTVFASENRAENVVGGGMNEIQEVNEHHLVQIDVMSFDGSSRQARGRISMALRSLFSQKQQEINNLQIARLPGEWLNISSLEITAFLERYTATIAISAMRRNVIAVEEYYDQFPTPEVAFNV